VTIDALHHINVAAETAQKSYTAMGIYGLRQKAEADLTRIYPWGVRSEV